MYRFEAFQRMLDRARSVRGVALMGICNVTPDSFSDGGRYLALDAARARVDEILGEGADIVDVGGESTRPGAVSVPADQQIHRVLDVVRHAASRGACVSIDTTSAAVAAACLEVGACAVNDVSCLRDPALGEVVASAGAAIVLMHTRGTPEQMPGFSRYPEGGYRDVVAEVCAEWAAAAARARSVGVRSEAPEYWIAPGRLSYLLAARARCADRCARLRGRREQKAGVAAERPLPGTRAASARAATRISIIILDIICN